MFRLEIAGNNYYKRREVKIMKGKYIALSLAAVLLLSACAEDNEANEWSEIRLEQWVEV
jgi:hypothetical protein